MKVRQEPFKCKKCKQDTAIAIIDMQNNCIVDYCQSCGYTVKSEDFMIASKKKVEGVTKDVITEYREFLEGVGRL